MTGFIIYKNLDKRKQQVKVNTFKKMYQSQ